MSDCLLDRVTLAMVSLAANIAANHPKKGLCQLERLRREAGQMLDHEFDTAPAQAPVSLDIAAPAGACCSPTAKGNICC